jgi:hypothetical protein
MKKAQIVLLTITLICLSIMVTTSFLIGLETGRRLPISYPTAMAVNATLITHKDMHHPISTVIPDGEVLLLEDRGNEYMVRYVPTGQYGFLNKADVRLDESRK